MVNNQELFYRLSGLSEDKLISNIELLKNFLGVKGYKAPVNEDTCKRAEDLFKTFVPDRQDVRITIDGSPNLKDIIEVAKSKLAHAESLQKISEIKEDEDLSPKNFKYLNSFISNEEEAFANFCKAHSLGENSKQKFLNIKLSVEQKLKNIRDKTEARNKTRVLSLSSSIDNKIKKLDETLKNIDIARGNIKNTLQSIEAQQKELMRKMRAIDTDLKKERKKEIKQKFQDSLAQKKAELSVLNATHEKLGLIDARLEHRYSIACKNIKQKLEECKEKISAETYKSFDLGKPAFGIAADERAFIGYANIVDELSEDIQRCERVIHIGDITAANPSKQLHAKVPVNAFINVLALADITSFNENGTPYFIDEIIDKNTKQPKLKDERVMHGLEGEVITRGVYLKPGEIKRSSYVDSNKNKVVIETSIVKSKTSGDYSVAKVEYSSQGNLSKVDKKRAAFQFAKELLRQYKEGSQKTPIKIKARKPKEGDVQDAALLKEQATMVYATLLMLTSPENKGEDYIHLPAHMLEIDVKGIEKPAFFTWSWDSKRDFINKYFKDPEERKEKRDEVTSEYRFLRQNIDNKGLEIVENAADDVYTHSLKPKQ